MNDVVDGLIVVVIMICVCLILEAKHGQDHWDTRLWMNGDHGCLMPKFLGIET